MAIYHLHGQIIGRSDGRSVVNAAAYRAGEALYDRRLGKEFDYTRKAGVEESVILGSDHAPKWMFDRELLWNAVEQAERRANSQLAREFDVAIPVELARKSPRAAKEAVRSWATEMFVSQGLMVDISFHDMTTRNPHAHVLVCMRRVHAQAAEFETGSRHAFETHKARELDDRGYMDFWRECWADIANEALAAEGFDDRIDHRSLIDQGILDREPGVHIGPNANAMAARGIDADRWTKNAIIWFQNEEPFWEGNRAYLEWAEAEERRRESVSAETSIEPSARAEMLAPSLREEDTPIMRLEPYEQARPSSLDHALAWFVAEEDYWRTNREMLPWLEEQERELLAREAEEAERQGAAAKEVEAARAIIAQADRLQELGLELIGTFVRSNHSKKAALAGLTSRLKENQPDVSRARAKLDTVVTQLQNAAPQVSTLGETLNGLGGRLSAAMNGSIAAGVERLTASDWRLQVAKTNLVELAREQLVIVGQNAAAEMGEGLLGLIAKSKAGMSKLWIGAKDLFTPTLGKVSQMPSAADLCTEKTRLAPDHGAEAEEDHKAAVVLSDAEIQNQRWSDALRLLTHLESEQSRAKVSSTRNGWVVEPSSVPPAYRELLERVADHRLITDYIDCRRKGVLSAWGKLLHGDEPVVRREQGRFIVIDDAVPEWLRENGQRLLDQDLGFQMQAQSALNRWSGVTSVPSQSVVRPTAPTQTHVQLSTSALGQQPDWYEQLVERSGKDGSDIDFS